MLRPSAQPFKPRPVGSSAEQAVAKRPPLVPTSVLGVWSRADEESLRAWMHSVVRRAVGKRTSAAWIMVRATDLSNLSPSGTVAINDPGQPSIGRQRGTMYFKEQSPSERELVEHRGARSQIDPVQVPFHRRVAATC